MDLGANKFINKDFHSSFSKIIYKYPQGNGDILKIINSLRLEALKFDVYVTKKFKLHIKKKKKKNQNNFLTL